MKQKDTITTLLLLNKGERQYEKTIKHIIKLEIAATCIKNLSFIIYLIVSFCVILCG